MSSAKATTTGPTRKTIRLSSIVLDRKLWPRQGLDADRVGEFKTLYKEEPDTLPVIVVAEYPGKPGKYRLIDGWHRVSAISALYKEAEIPADVHGKDTDVYAEATRLSSISSKPLTILEKRAAVRRLLDEHPKWSDREIARVAGVSNVFVGSQRKMLTRLAGEAKDMMKKVLEPAPGDTRSGSATAPAKQEAPGINQLLFNLLTDARIGQINLEVWRAALAKYPDAKPAARHVATVLYQASRDAAPARPGVNVNAGTEAAKQP